MGGMGKVSSIHFDTADLPEGKRLDAWRAMLPAYDLFLPDDSEPASFRVCADAWMLGDIVVTATQLSPMRFVRTAQRLQADRCNHFCLLLPKQGSWTGDADGRMVTVGPGKIVIFDRSRPFHIAGTGSDTATITLTRAAMEAAGVRGPDLHGLMFQGLAERVLADHMMLLIRQLPAMAASDVTTTVSGTVDLIAGCIKANPKLQHEAMPDRDDKVRHRVDRYIDQNLGLRDLSLRKICREIGVSRSVLYRAFAPLGGVADYVRARRLEAAHVSLENPAGGRAISDVARDLGFVSDAHFSRAFKQRYGYSPRHARNRQTPALRDLAPLVDTHAAGEIFRTWLAQIRA
jgi:AraC-like DNA-binding protein